MSNENPEDVRVLCIEYIWSEYDVMGERIKLVLIVSNPAFAANRDETNNIGAM
jgi:hypothetical protein